MNRRPDDWDLRLDSPDEPRPALPETVFEIERWLRRLPACASKTLADLGCGLGSRLGMLRAKFDTVIAIDPRRPAAAPAAMQDADGIELCRRGLLNLEPFHGRLDVAIAIGTIATPRLSDFDRILFQVRHCLVEGGLLLATFPAAPKSTIARAMLLDGGDETPAPTEFHEIELQYRLRRAGLRGAAMRRLAENDGRESIVCRAVRRADN